MTTARALAATLATAATAALIAVLPAQGQDAPVPRSLKFTSSQKQGEEHYIDLRPKGPSAGDRMVLSSTLRRQGTVAGRLEADCAWVEKPYAVLQCAVVLMFPDGRVTLLGAYAGKRIPGIGGTREEYAVTGGTGAYEGATGTLLRTGGGTRDTLTLTLR